MIRFTLNSILLLLPLVLVASSSAQELPLTVADLQRTETVDFAKEIMPILKRNCLACHHEKEAEGGLILESADAIHKGGDSGSGVNVDEPLESLILSRAAGIEEPLMPPEDNSVGANPLTPDELGLLKLWIEQGAKAGDSMAEAIVWQEIPESVRASLALEVSPDGQLAAFSRGNRVLVVDLATYQPTSFLIDPEVAGQNAAHVDLVQSIAISPDAQRIATGGFRTVKIWKKEPLATDHDSLPLRFSGGLVAVKPGETHVAIVNPVGDIEVWETAERQRLHTLSGHSDRISGLAWSATGDRLVSCDASGRVIVWNAKSGQMICDRESGHVLVEMVVSADGLQLAGIDLSGKLLRMQVDAEGNEIQPVAFELEGVTQVTSAIFTDQPSPALIVADQAAGVMVVSLSDQTIQRKIDAGSIVDAMALSPDASKLLTGCRDGKTRIWDLQSGSAVMTLEGDPKGQLQLAYATREAQRQKSAVERLNNQTAELEKRLENESGGLTKATEEHQKAATALEESEKKRLEAAMLVATTQQAIEKANQDAAQANSIIESAKTKLAASTTMIESINKELESKATNLSTANDQVEKFKAEIAAMNKALEDAVGRANEVQKQVDEKNAVLAKAKESTAAAQSEIDSATKVVSESTSLGEQSTKELEAQQKNLASSEEAKKAGEAELAKRQQALDTAAQAKKRAEAAIPAQKLVIEAESRRQAFLEQRLSDVERQRSDLARRIRSLAISETRNLVASSHDDSSVSVFRLSDGKPVARFQANRGRVSGNTARLTWLGDHIIESEMASPTEVWSTQFNWSLEQTIGSLDDPSTISDRVTALDFGRDGLSIAVGSGPPSRSGEVKVFTIPSGQLVRDFGPIHSDTVLGLAFSPRGQVIASAAADKTIRLLDITTGKVLRALEGHTHHVLSIAWQDDGQSIASAGADRTVKIWDAETGEQRRTISGFGKEITSLRFISATNQLATACADGQVRLYDTSNGQAIRTFNAEGDFLFTLGVSLDGKTVAASGQSGVLRVWNVEDAKLLGDLK